MVTALIATGRQAGAALRTPRVALGGVYAGQYLFLGIQLPFFSAWLEAKGFEIGMIGALITTALILRLIFATLIAYQSEKLSDPRIAVRGTTGALAFLSLSLLFVPSSFLIAAMVVLMLFVFGLLIPLSDSAVLRADQRGEVRYGPLRGIGSFAFVVANLGGGLLLSSAASDRTVILMAGAACLAFVASWLLPREAEVTARVRPTIAGALKLFSSKRFLLLLLGAGSIQASHATYYAYSILDWQLRFSPFAIGALWTAGVITEIVLLVKSGSLMERIGPIPFLLAGAGGAVVRWALTALTLPLGVLFLVQTMHALTFAATYLGTVAFVARAVPSQYRITAMTLISTFGVGAFTGLATSVAAMVFTPTNAAPAYLLMAALGGVGFCFLWALKSQWSGERLAALTEDSPQRESNSA